MNRFFALDQSEKVGLGAAVGGHVLLLALLVFGLFQAARPSGADGGGGGDGIAVEIVSESAAMASANPAPEPLEEIAEVIEPLPETVVEPDPLPKIQPKPDTLAKPQNKPQNKPQTKPVQKSVQKQTKTGTGKGGKSDFEREMEKKLGGLGGGDGPNTKKDTGSGSGTGPTAQQIAEIRTKTSNTIAEEVKPFVPNCAPPTSDNSSLRVFVQLNIGPTANLIGANVYKVEGITSANQAQVELMKACVLSSLRRASPYNLKLDQYDTWRNHKVQLKVNFK